MRKKKLTPKDLTSCGHVTEEMYVVSKCHPRLGVSVLLNYKKNTVRIQCAGCMSHIATVEVKRIIV